jgi:hydrogenase maturation factor
MDCGKLTESIYERSVNKVIKANSIENRKYYDGAGLGADCAILADSKSSNDISSYFGIMSGQAMSSGNDSRVGERAYMAAVNQLIAGLSNSDTSGLLDAYANLTFVVPEKLREVKVRGMVEAVAVAAEKTGVPILGCNVQVLNGVTQTVATCVVNTGLSARADGQLVRMKKKAEPGEDIVMTKWLGLEGTAIIANKSMEALKERYPGDIVDMAASFYDYMSIATEAAVAVKSGANSVHVLREGGVFGGLWRFASDNGVGLVIDLKEIPVRQETIEVCEFYDLNPYELICGGSLLITSDNGGELVGRLLKAGIHSAVIGLTTDSNDRVICHDEEKRFLEPARGDEIYTYYKKISEVWNNEGTDFINNREEQ